MEVLAVFVALGILLIPVMLIVCVVKLTTVADELQGIKRLPMKKFTVIAVLSVLAGVVSAENKVYPVKGEVAETSAAAVSIDNYMYLDATPGRENALASELRVYEDGKPIPYAIRRQKIRKTVEKVRYHSLTVTGVSETNGTLVVEAELPKSQVHPEKFTGLWIKTPLTDFEQVVTVKVGDSVVATDCICDYSRFAKFRRTEFPMVMPYADRLTLVFARPVSEVESAKFERTITEGASGTVEAKSLRRAVQERPFRIDALRLAETYSETVFEPAPPWEGRFRAEIERDAKAKKTNLTCDFRGIPLCALGICTKDENFSRMFRILARRGAGWSVVAGGRFKVISLPGKNEMVLEEPFEREVREQTLRIELDDGDNPPLKLEELAAQYKSVPYDVVFVARPGAKYEVVLERGAERPRYDQVALEYIDAVKDPVRLDIVLPTSFGKDGPTAVWLTTSDPVPWISLAVFIALGGLCFWLFRSANRG